MNTLPIHSLFPQLQSSLTRNNQLVIQSPTGSGKSTALPLAMMDWPQVNGKILMLEPRRVATRSIAKFIAQQRGTELGDEVGYRVRGDKKVSVNTRLEIVTEGILSRMIQNDPELTGIGMIIFDEVHERHLTTDLGLALALEVQQSLRDDLKLVLMSATLCFDDLKALLPTADYLESEGRSFPVSIEYSPSKDPKAWLSHTERTIRSLITNNSQGDILVFLPGKGEILKLEQELNAYNIKDVCVLTLYGELGHQAQDAVLKPNLNQRKVILSTNIAESSLTIDGIKWVIDSGLKRHASYNPKTGVTRLSLKPISQSSATQRSGRAGRTAEGHCIRLWRQEDHQRRVSTDTPEIADSDLLSMAHHCSYWGSRQFDELPLLTQPPAVHQQKAWELLQSLEFVDDSHKITTLGKRAFELGTEPRLAHMLLKVESNPQQLGLACLLTAVLEARGLPRKSCDIQHYLNLCLKGSVGQQAKSWLKRFNITLPITDLIHNADWQTIGLLLAYAFPDRIAKSRSAGRFLMANGSGVIIDEQDPLAQHTYVVIADLQEMDGKSDARGFLAAQCCPDLFEHELNYLLQTHTHSDWDKSSGRFIAEQQQRIGRIVVAKQKLNQLTSKQQSDAIVSYVHQQGLTVLSWNDNTIQLQQRLLLAEQYLPQLEWPDISSEWLSHHLSLWLTPYLSNITNLKQLSQIDTYQILWSLLNWEQQTALDQHLPTRWPLVTGTKAPLTYTNEGRVLMSVRLQEALGLAESPKLANHQLTVTMELLSPARRPIAVTADLASFWQGPYNEVKKEMRGKYPKHLWPDDPQNTQATKLTKKKLNG
ncbi:ATP-dependent helicase HrpB [Parashewanella curva]|uniref:ATP-dependent helicase HrpB n=1 Tax=Parashewanella curva TaxID=2338552 RepID=A0A3L8PXR8_9GAMM|nr:ATP-dependent helicase HrpB [Parashewanella curva]RLV59248.1 ATP-dependent helicase HrpB [Parashewanella curva]